ncbi:MAG TPA: LPS export ABC transporter permease LptF [Steroidobacteraceae bacterium]|jgi:lipopolysaccharide export system permease protein
MIIQRYLLREIIQPLAVVLVVLATLFTSFGAADFLSNAVNALLPAHMIVQLVGLRTVIALEVLIPISLYLSVVMAFGRLYSDSEVAVMFAMGFSPARVMGAVFALSLTAAIAVAVLSFLVRPWAYQRSHELSSVAAASFDTGRMQAGTFYVGSRGDRTIFIGRRAAPNSPGYDVFVQLRLRGIVRVIHAGSVEQAPGHGTQPGTTIHLTDAHVYDVSRERGGELVMNVKDLEVDLASPEVELPEYSSLAAGTRYLASSRASADVAEFQWRLSTSWSTLLLGLLGVPLSRTRPRAQRFAKIGLAVLIYGGYYLLYESARTWVQNGVIPPFPGLWWVPALLAVLLITATLGPSVRRRWRRLSA